MSRHSGTRRGTRLKPEARLLIESLLATCTPTSLIKKQLVTKFGCSDRSAGMWITQAVDMMADEAKPFEKDARRAQLRVAFSDFYQKALLARQFNSAVTALDRLCKLDGLYAPDDQTTKVMTGVVERDPDKLRERIRTLASKFPHLLEPRAEAAAALAAEPAPEEPPTAGDEEAPPNIDDPSDPDDSGD